MLSVPQVTKENKAPQQMKKKLPHSHETKLEPKTLQSAQQEDQSKEESDSCSSLKKNLDYIFNTPLVKKERGRRGVKSEGASAATQSVANKKTVRRAKCPPSPQVKPFG